MRFSAVASIVKDDFA